MDRPLYDSRTAFVMGVVCVLIGYGSLVLSIAAPHDVGPPDWHLAAGMLECFRKIVLEYGQFPWWNPYSAGGYPYFGSSLTAGAFSVPAVLSLLLGPITSLKVGIVAFAVGGYAGMFRLAGRATREPLFRAVAGVLFACNGGIILHLATGHLFFDYFAYPWLVCFLLETNDATGTRERFRSATWAGFVFAFTAQHVIHYGFVYMALSILGAFLVGVVVRMKRRGAEGRQEALSLCVAYGQCAFTFVAVAGVRFYLANAIMRDFPRRERLDVTFDGWKLLRIFVEPGQTTFFPLADGLGWWEWGFYLGGLATALFVFSMCKRPRFEHGVALVGIALFASSARGTPYYLLNEYVPVFQSMRVAPRIRIWLAPFIAMGVVRGLQILRSRHARWWWVARALALVVLIDVTGNASFALHTSLHDDRHPFIAETLPRNEKPYPVVYRDTMYGFSLYHGVRNGYSHVPGYEPAISGLLYQMDRGKQPLVGANEPGYATTFRTETGPIEPTSWSPNRIVFEGVRGELRANMNPGSYWTVNGEHVFAGYRVSEIEKPFVAHPDSNGRIVLEIVPKGLTIGIVLSAIASMLAAAGLIVTSRRAPSVDRAAERTPAREAT